MRLLTGSLSGIQQRDLMNMSSYRRPDPFLHIDICIMDYAAAALLSQSMQHFRIRVSSSVIVRYKISLFTSNYFHIFLLNINHDFQLTFPYYQINSNYYLFLLFQSIQHPYCIKQKNAHPNCSRHHSNADPYSVFKKNQTDEKWKT